MPITQVGATVSGTAVSGANVTLTLPAGMAENDMVLLVGGHALAHSATPADPPTTNGPSTGGYTAIVNSHTQNGAFDSITLGSWRKFMGATPDTSVVGLGDTLAADGTVYHAIVLRGVDLTTPVDATAAMVRPGGTSPPDCPSITVVTVGAWVFAIGGCAVNDATVTAPTGYTGLAWSSVVDTNLCGLGFAYKEATATGAEDPGAYADVGALTSPGGFTIAIRPASGSTPIAGDDTGSGADTATLTASQSATDTGAGTDSASSSAALTGSDTGAGADVASLVVDITATDTATGVDTAVVDAGGTTAKAGDDTATGVDTASVSRTGSTADTATASDAGSTAASLSATDTATAVDSAFVTVILAATDTASATDLATLANAVAASDLATALESASYVDPGVIITTPAARTLVVAAETRALVVPAEDRVLTVPPETRTLEA